MSGGGRLGRRPALAQEPVRFFRAAILFPAVLRL